MTDELTTTRYSVLFEAHPKNHPGQMDEINQILTANLPGETKINVRLQAELTLAEFQAIGGNVRSLVESISMSTHDEDHYSIQLSAADAMEYGYGEDSVQTKAITALAPDENWRAKDAAEISPDAVLLHLMGS